MYMARAYSVLYLQGAHHAHVRERRPLPGEESRGAEMHVERGKALEG